MAQAQSQVQVKPAPQPASPEETPPFYPAGEDAVTYRWAVSLFVILFLGVVCIGLLNYLGMFVKKTALTGL